MTFSWPLEITLADRANSNQNGQRAADGKAAIADYEAQAAAIRAKTERLRALRLARDAVEKAPKVAASGRNKPAKTRKGMSASLSEWLKDQEKGGRRT